MFLVFKMSVNIKNIRHSDFINICRTCMFNCDLKPIQQNNVTLEILHILTGIRFGINDELPQQICQKCLEEINNINAFAFQCRQTHYSLTNCLINFKNTQQNNESIKVKEEKPIQEKENNTEFVQVNDYFDEFKHKVENEIKQEISQKKDGIEEISDSNINDSIESTQEEISAKNNYACDVCNKTFIHSTSLKRHKIMHSGKRPYECDVCSKSFFRPSLLENHKRIHSGERPFQCDQCSVSFTESKYLKRHILSHSGERPFKCDICTKTYTYKKDLKIHQIIHSDDLPYKCDVCSKAFNCPGILRSHKSTHSSERPFECDICQKTFKLSSHLIGHKKVHSGECPFQCDVCTKSFKLNKDLIRHKRIHSGERPYKCNVCNKCFIESGALNKHKKRHEKRLK